MSDGPEDLDGTYTSDDPERITPNVGGLDNGVPSCQPKLSSSLANSDKDSH